MAICLSEVTDILFQSIEYSTWITKIQNDLLALMG